MADTSPRPSAAVHAEQIRTLYSQSPAILAVNPLNAAIVSAVLWPWANRGMLVGWVAAMAVVAVVRGGLRRRYLDARPSDELLDLWARRLVWSSVTAGLLWGIGGAVFYDTRALIPQSVLIFVIGGMVAGASGVLALHLPAFIGFAVSAILPVAARIVAEGDVPHVAMGALTIVYGGAMTMLTAHSNRAVTEALRLRFENQDLLARLSAAQVSLEQTNQTLEQRVVERGDALARQSEALRDAQRMESVGLLAGGMAHDFNNLLTVVLGNIDLLLGDASRTPKDRSSLEEIQGAANRGATLVSQLLAFSRRQVMVHQVLDLSAVVAEVRPLLTRLIGEHIDLVITVAPEPLPVRADPTQIHQTIINLATNARDAMAEGGTLTIETRVEDAQAGSTLPAGRYAALSVRDTGVGMDDATRRMVFHPFFTTKQVGKGTGLGLATVHGIVEQSGGHVIVDSEPGRGSCFHVFLPWVGDEQVDAAAPPARSVPAAPLYPATILVVEDEAPVRAITARILGKAGYAVLEAEDGERALEIVYGTASSIDLVISDVVMARMGGIELARRLAAERPGLPVLLVSGYNPEAQSADDSIRPIDILQKPFRSDQLLERVSALLACAGSGATT